MLKKTEAAQKDTSGHSGGGRGLALLPSYAFCHLAAEGQDDPGKDLFRASKEKFLWSAQSPYGQGT